mmetsp:Transcript_34636/g.52971  ORF Transcript_34636/g.52971 Transcript_34636/m.52971 type:complete len:146 (+) Transcript_34636:283-720(+)
MLRDDGADVTMDLSSNAKDTGKLSGYSPLDDKINQMFEIYSGSDNDEFMKEVIEDYGTQGKKTAGNPGGVVLTKFNGERATRRFVETALKLKGVQLNDWMKENFAAAWKKYDVNNEGLIQADMVSTYFRSLLGDFSAQFNLREED